MRSISLLSPLFLTSAENFDRTKRGKKMDKPSRLGIDDSTIITL